MHIAWQSTNVPVKRPSEGEEPAAKKIKREAPPKPALSSLLKKVQHTNDKVASSTETNGIKEHETAKNEETKTLATNTAVAEATKDAPGKNDYFKSSADYHPSLTRFSPSPPAPTEKKMRKIRWADNLAVTHEKTEEAKATSPPAAKKSGDQRVNRWAKKKDISHEKDMLLQAR